ncbi:MAG: A/G-specific adenine glycosylase [Coriobacteriia bacterium]|nr:A/G-specific adenine glycosylase [Coriobacteriia bacterium]
MLDLPLFPGEPAFREMVRARGVDLYRDMPWRHVDDPYAVLVSEVMLQQTQVPRVIPKYREWMVDFPTLDALAAAPLACVLERWQGLGYNRRALALKRAAEQVSLESGGVLPSDPMALRVLPGIGPATAAAVANYAFRVPTPFIETNVRAVYLHHLFADADGVSDRDLRPVVERTWDRDDPRGWGYALMDYGSWLKRAFPNPSRRSSHHTRQSPFEGSRRQKRARLLRAVMDGPGATAAEYAVEIGLGEPFVLELLEELEGEGFLSRTGVGGGWTIGE